MAEDAPLPSFAAIVVAAGKGLRAGGEIPKQFRKYRGKPMVRHSVEALLEQGASTVWIVIPEGQEGTAQDALAGLDGVRFVV